MAATVGDIDIQACCEEGCTSDRASMLSQQGRMLPLAHVARPRTTCITQSVRNTP